MILGWESLPLFSAGRNHIPEIFITVIIPARNEEKKIEGILNDLSLQSYPASHFEVIVADDSSEDRTVERINSFLKKKSLPLRIISLSSLGKSGKKKAIEEAIKISKGNLIVTTDADCHAGPGWLAAIEDYYRRTGAKMICGPVAFLSSGSLWEEMQQIEFAGLVGTSGASLALGFPNMCNGANIAYEKDVFLKVNGFAGNENIASGDDEFLMHKIAGMYPGKVKFLKSRETIIKTAPSRSWKDFINQRIRWAGKWKNYTLKGPRILAGFIFFFNLVFLVGWISAFTGYLDPVLFLQQIVIKILFEFVFLKRVLALSGKKINLFPLLLIEVIYPFYVVISALFTLKGNYSWKGRTINNFDLDRSRI
jgi:cellulose synthase/poly-beta-1,6-N-acetylglucosamine synthase-like glycosyltransferase